MMEFELETSKKSISKQDIKKIDDLERWFRFDYPARLNKIHRHQFLGLSSPESRYALELEAYDKENELRQLKGLEPLEKIKFKNLF